MNEKKIEQNIKNKVFEKIHGGEVSMKTRSYFILRFVVTAIIALLALIISVLVISFVFFSIHESGEDFLLGFGRKGLFTFIQLFPWGYLILDVLILLLLEWLIQGFKIGYRISLLTIFLVTLAASCVLGIIVNLTPFHTTLLNEADKGVLPVMGEMYESIRDTHTLQGVYKGTIASIQGNEIVITHDDHDHDDDDGTWTVMLPQNHPPLQIGDRVYVFGKPLNGVVQALDIRKLSKEQ